VLWKSLKLPTSHMTPESETPRVSCKKVDM
jgi:hypothetical protein